MIIEGKKIISFVLLLTAFNFAFGGELTPEKISQELTIVTTSNLNADVWGLVVPESLVPIFELDAADPEARDLWPILPEQAVFSDGTLKFALRGGKAMLGIGNCENKLPAGRRANFGQRFTVEIEVEQADAGPIVWTLVPWTAGTRTRLYELADYYEASAKRRKTDVNKDVEQNVWRFCRRKTEGSGRHLIRIEDTGAFYRRQSNQPFDGLELEIEGTAGAQVAIRKIRVLRKERVGGFRKEVVLPTGRVWRAVAGINCKTILHINGREVPGGTMLNTRPNPHFTEGQRLQEVDLKPYLSAGTNVLAVYPAFATDAAPLMHAQVVMESGEKISLNTDMTWRYVPQSVAGWDTLAYSGASEAITNELPFSAQYVPTQLSAIRYGYRIYMQYTHAMPPYTGRLLLIAPDDNQLYISGQHPFRLLARAPAGMAQQEPMLEWLLCKYTRGGKLEHILDGISKTFRQSDDTLEFVMESQAKLPVGVYVLKAVLRNLQGEILEDRQPEAVLVTDKIAMGRTDGRSFEDGLDLELEATLDLTKTDDPNWPWMEIDGKQVCTEPLVVTRNGLTYRETRSAASDYNEQVLISYNYNFKQPGDFYLMTLEYPDDQPRFFGVNLCSEHDGPGDHSKAGPSVWTGICHLNTGKMQTMQWLFRPDPDWTSINLINLLPGSAAAAASLRIERVKGNLPELHCPGNARHFGILTESARAASGFGKTFRSSDNPKKAGDTILVLDSRNWQKTAAELSPLIERLDSFAEWLDACQKYAEYMRWSGQNIICMAYYQYTSGNLNAEPNPLAGDGRVAFHITDIAARVFRDNGIDFLAGIEYCTDLILHEKYANNTDIGKTPLLVNAAGKTTQDGKTGYNFNHPEVRASISAVAEEATHKFEFLPNFRGVTFQLGFKAPMTAPNYITHERRNDAPDPLWFDYSDATMLRFEADTGIKLDIPKNSPERFDQRHKALTSDALRSQWITWRTRNMLGFFLETRDALRTIKPDVEVIAGLYAAPIFDYMTASGKTMETCLIEFGFDFPAFHAQEGLTTMPWLQGSGRYDFTARGTAQTERYLKYLRSLQANSDLTHVRIGDGAINRTAMIYYGWLELERAAQRLLPKQEHWQVPYQYTMEGAPQGATARRPFMDAMLAVDYDTFLFGFTDQNLMIGNEQPLREWAQFLRSLPKQKFESVNGPDKELTVRQLTQNGKLIFYALNPAPWPVEAVLSLEAGGKIKNLITDEMLVSPIKTIIPAYGGISFEAEAKAVISGWQTTGSGEIFNHYAEHISKTSLEAAKRLDDRRIASALLPEEQVVLRKLLEQTQLALQNRCVAEAWQIVSSWPFIWHAHFLERQSEALEQITEHNPPAPDLNRNMLTAKHTVAPPIIDGAIDDACWENAEAQSGFIDKDGNPSQLGTTVRAAWDEKFLYLAFECRDNFPGQIKADAATEREVMRGDDCVVFLLQPDLERRGHYQLAFNPAGQKFDQQDFDYAFAPDWQVAVQRGTNNWTAEAAFPFDALGRQPSYGVVWGANFARFFRNNLLPWSVWNYMPPPPDFHKPEHYGQLNFQ